MENDLTKNKDGLIKAMTCTEFRIGNLVYNKHKEIHAIGWQDFQNWRQPRMDHDYGFYLIPLTPEWVERLGFQLGIDEHYKFLNTKDKYISIRKSGTHWFPQLNQAAEMSSQENNIVFLDFIDHVHDLQNLYYALTKTELTLTPKQK